MKIHKMNSSEGYNRGSKVYMLRRVAINILQLTVLVARFFALSVPIRGVV